MTKQPTLPPPNSMKSTPTSSPSTPPPPPGKPSLTNILPNPPIDKFENFVAIAAKHPEFTNPGNADVDRREVPSLSTRT
ncbi:hypothetical protein H257_13333 [Aphanomyces astaci]|uniref:Uncharacterized protein n=1 Tax=Aphanomyces astaci TaxID=112090 RepID=W4FVB1_APHAT|nr:hypothetical protein H257_13333 [Aphanomyces astaci]ETV71455.1 hypothetical protein H257_13333 [Aphanomyces astaci]|eukprot:XP_009839120.1 hypothetical protein H257_13333 [Aphanomyces astaci]